jgi:hypothetical protein
MNDRFIDIHCHSVLKPYSKSFKNNGREGRNNINSNREESVWFDDGPTDIDKILNEFLSVTKFRQANFSTSHKGGVRVMMVSIDPMEKGFVFNKRRRPKSFLGKLFYNFVTGIGQARIDVLLDLTNYYSDLKRGYKYLEELNGKSVQVDGKTLKYKLVDKYVDIDLNQKDTLNVVLTIEGGHVFNTGLELANVITDAVEVLNNVKDMKSDVWKVKPFFVSLAHHFPNQLCGQAQSFKGISKLAYDQKLNKNEGLTFFGNAVIKELLDDNNGKKRIYIDVKHMNLKSRYEYYESLENGVYKDENIPIIVSHGALRFKNRPSQNTNEINFYNEEIVKVGNSGGIFGVQLDERRLLKRRPPKRIRDLKVRPKRQLYKKAYYVWRQIEGIALLLYADREFMSNNKDPWGIQALGSDFDGIVDPLDGFWSHKEYKLLAHYLRLHAGLFLKSNKARRLPNHGQLTADSIIEKFLFLNADAFMRTYLK